MKRHIETAHQYQRIQYLGNTYLISTNHLRHILRVDTYDADRMRVLFPDIPLMIRQHLNSNNEFCITIYSPITKKRVFIYSFKHGWDRIITSTKMTFLIENIISTIESMDYCKICGEIDILTDATYPINPT